MQRIFLHQLSIVHIWTANSIVDIHSNIELIFVLIWIRKFLIFINHAETVYIFSAEVKSCFFPRLLCPNEFVFKKYPIDTHFCSLFFERIWGSIIAKMDILIQSWIHLLIFIDYFECIFRLTNYIAPILHWILFFISNVDLLSEFEKFIIHIWEVF